MAHDDEPGTEAAWERTVPRVQLTGEALDGVLGPLGPATRAVPLTAGKGNTNLMVHRGHGPPVVVRIYQRDEAAAQRERRLFDWVGTRLPIPPVRRWTRLPDGPPVAVMDHVRGLPVDAVLAGGADPHAVGRALGRTLAPLAAMTVDTPGLYAPDLSLARRFDSVGHSFVDLIAWSLRAGRARKRLHGPLRRRLAEQLDDLAQRMEPLDTHLCLVHGDYKSANLLLQPAGRDWRVAAVLDWEFACPYTPLLDVAICFRHRDRWPAGVAEGFEAAYREGGGWLPDDWRSLSRVVDLMNLVGFLNASGDRPRLYADVVARIATTLSAPA